MFGRGTTVKALENVPLLGGINHGTLVVYRDDNLAALLQDRNSNGGANAGRFAASTMSSVIVMAKRDGPRTP